MNENCKQKIARACIKNKTLHEGIMSNPTAIIPPPPTPRATPGHLTYDYLRIGGHLTEVYSGI